MKFQTGRLELLIFIFLLAIVMFINLLVIKHRTGVKPRATLTPEGTESLSDFIDREGTIPTPVCQVDADGCSTCCIYLKDNTICQNRICPAEKPFKVE